MKFGTRDFYENLQTNSELGYNRTKISGTSCEDLSVFHIVESDFGSATTAQRTHYCAVLATLAIFITL
jgi:hypothetical protein